MENIMKPIKCCFSRSFTWSVFYNETFIVRVHFNYSIEVSYKWLFLETELYILNISTFSSSKALQVIQLSLRKHNFVIRDLITLCIYFECNVVNKWGFMSWFLNLYRAQFCNSGRNCNNYMFVLYRTQSIQKQTCLSMSKITITKQCKEFETNKIKHVNCHQVSEKGCSGSLSLMFS